MNNWNVVEQINGGVPPGDGSALTPWNGRSNIVWGGAGVVAGDTLFCLPTNGNFTDGDGVGVSGSVGLKVTINMTDAVMARATAGNDWSVYNRNYLTFQGGDMRGGGGSGNDNSSIVVSDGNNIDFFNQIFNNTTDEAVRLAVNAGISGLRVEGVTLNGEASGISGEGFRVSFAGNPSGILYDVLVTDCIANQRQLYRDFWFDYDTAVLLNGRRPKKIVIQDSILNGPNVLPVSLSGSEGTLEDQCYIRRLTCLNTGALTVDRHNTIQTGNNIDLIICDNYIYNTYTDPSAGDGHAIIIDWYGTGNIPSERMQVLRNRCEKIESVPNAYGVNCWRGQNSRIIANEVLRSNGGIEVQNDDPGNVVANNLCKTILTSAGRTNSQPTQPSYWYNNIFMEAVNYGLVDNTPGTLVESNNCYWNNGTDAVGFTPTNPVYADPLFVDPDNDDYNLQQTSPCVGAGIKWWGNGPRPESKNGEPYPDTAIDIGPNQSTWSKNHPVNL